MQAEKSSAPHRAGRSSDYRPFVQRRRRDRLALFRALFLRADFLAPRLAAFLGPLFAARFAPRLADFRALFLAERLADRLAAFFRARFRAVDLAAFLGRRLGATGWLGAAGVALEEG
jgi:hypothetical protein